MSLPSPRRCGPADSKVRQVQVHDIGPPILIAGSGERQTLRLVARYADACNLRLSPEIPRQLDLLRRLCEQEGRADAAIEKTAPFGLDVGPGGSKVGELLGQLRGLASMGIETVFGWVVGVDRITPIEVMGREVIPAVAELEAPGLGDKISIEERARAGTMFKIGDFSRLTQVTIKALRHYDNLGLLKPAHVDSVTGYRYYSATQLQRLNRILALKDLGLSLEQIGPFLDAELSSDQLRALLLVKQGELQQQIEQEQARLQRIETRLRQIEQSTTPADYDVMVRRVAAQTVASIRAVLPNHAAIVELFRELNVYRQRHHLNATAWTAIWHDPEHHEREVDAEATFTSADPLPDDGRIRPRELPAVKTMACTVHHGPAATIGTACTALLGWIEGNGYDLAGSQRVLSVQRGSDGEDTVVEIQVPIRTGGKPGD